MLLTHLTLETGHISHSPLGWVSPDVTQVLAQWLSLIANSGAAHPLPVPPLCHLNARAFVENGGLVLSLYAPHGPHVQGKPYTGPEMPLITMAVAKRTRNAAYLWSVMIEHFTAAPGLTEPETPWCVVALSPGIALYDGPVTWLGDFERSVAWAWLTRNPDLLPIKNKHHPVTESP